MIERERLLDWLGTATFAYLLAAGLAVIFINGYTARISFFNFLIPHASKVVLWSFVALFVLRPRFGFRFPFTVLLLYCIAELTTNWIYVPVHLLTDPTYLVQWTKLFEVSQNFYFVMSNIFFSLGIILSYTFLKGRFQFDIWDWSLLPFGVFIGFWVFTGYVTDSTLLYATPFSEFEEFTWNVLYLTVVYSIFKPKDETNILELTPILA